MSGEICTAAAGQVARFFAGRTRGYHNPALTAEYVRDHLDRIRDESDSFVPGVVETARCAAPHATHAGAPHACSSRSLLVHPSPQE
ncbi:hypothetical protein [Streptomyces niveus]|uniref:hypothetical protein n=1 Tax=Streptomyces niveus TaxID=193462 RepID=UPI0036D42245